MLPGQGVCLHEHTLVSSTQWDFSFSALNGKKTQHVNGAFNAAGLEVYLHSHVARQTRTHIIKRKFLKNGKEMGTCELEFHFLSFPLAGLLFHSLAVEADKQQMHH